MRTMKPFVHGLKASYSQPIHCFLFNKFIDGSHWDDFDHNICSYDTWDLWDFDSKSFRYRLKPEIIEWLNLNQIEYQEYSVATHYLIYSGVTHRFMTGNSPTMSEGYFFLGINGDQAFMMFKLRWL